MRCAATLLALLVAGCVAPELAALPEDGVFLSIAVHPSLKPYVNVWVVQANGSLGHLMFYARYGGGHDVEPAGLHADLAARLFEEALDVGALNANRYEAENATQRPAVTFMHAEQRPLERAEFERLRRHVAAADFPNLEPAYHDPDLDDGSGRDHVAWVDATYRHVYSYGRGAPPELESLGEDVAALDPYAH